MAVIVVFTENTLDVVFIFLIVIMKNLPFKFLLLHFNVFIIAIDTSKESKHHESIISKYYLIKGEFS